MPFAILASELEKDLSLGEYPLAALHYKRKRAETRLSSSEGVTPEHARRRTFDRAVKLLSSRSRSVAELRDLLLRGRGAKKEIVEEVLTRLKEYGYLDDERFALGYASLKLQQRPIGRRRLKRDLLIKKVDGATVDDALDNVFAEVTEEELIDRAIEKRIRVRGRPRTRAQAKSLFDHLLRQGFPYELVVEKVRAASQTDLGELE